MRLDRALSLYLFRPLNALRGQRNTAVPILMYHRVPTVDQCAGHPYYCTSTTVPVFERHMRYLHENGYRSVSVGEAFRAAQHTDAGLKKLVAITFDDGYGDFHRNAFPILNRYGHSATVFLPTAYIGEVPRRFKGSVCLTWTEIRELRSAGVEFGSHTITHPQLRDVSPKQLREELTGSKGQIEQKLGHRVDTFSYPYAFPETDRPFLARYRNLLEEAGYLEGVSTAIGCTGRNSDRLFMQRLPVNSHDDWCLFQSKLEGEYDWLHTLQYASKLMQSIR